ncbi:MAG: non-ribosomal peptide synthetase [Pseudomonadota bacterium]
MTSSTDSPAGATQTGSLDERLARLSPQQRELLLRNLAQRAAKSAPAAVAPELRAEPGQRLPLTPAQKQIWVFERLQPGTASYHIQHQHRIEGPLDADALARALAALVARHDALRMAFSERAGEPAQTVRDDVLFSLSTTDLSALSNAEREAEVSRRIVEDSLRPFDLSAPPLLRASLLKLGPTTHVLSIVAHHIVTDAWSFGVLEQDLIAHYRAFAAGRTPDVPSPPRGFADVALRWSQPEFARRIEGQLAYWADTLAGANALLDLPTDRPRGAQLSAAGARYHWSVPAELRAALGELARAEGATAFMALSCAFQALLARWSGDEDIVVGTPVTNRAAPGDASLVGLFVNTVALRANFADDPSFRQALARAKAGTLLALENAEAPLDRVIERVAPERVPGRTPLFQTLFVLQSGATESLRLGDARGEWIEPHNDAARFEITLSMTEDPDPRSALAALFDYSTELFDAATMARLAARFVALLRGAVAEPDRPLSRLPLLDADERAELLALGDGGPAPATEAPTLHGLFASQASRTPDAIALIEPGRTLTYAETARRAHGIAHALRASGVARGDRVALLADRSADAVIALYGILFAGAAYVPLDPGHPDERLAFLLEDAGARILLAPPAAAARAAGLPATALAVADLPEATHAPDDLVDAGDAAYLIYTSGSTGTPKGVLVEHRGAVNLVQGFLARHRFLDQRLLMIPPLIFDASVGDVFPALACGSALVLHPAPTELGPFELERFCEEHAVTAIDAPAALWRRWTEGWAQRDAKTPLLPALNLMMIGGESVPVALVRRFAAITGGRATLCNHYGPTEASVCATLLSTVDASEIAGLDLPIGRPLPGVRVYLLDRHSQLVPRGAVGELCIAGIGVARGYLCAEAQTAERFRDDPFVSGARMYRTGDLARWNADGTLQFIGRRDHQIKLRGFRIEPGEIEAALAALDGVRAAAVLLREDRPGDRRLVAYVVADDALDAASLRAALARRLPEAMLPSGFVFLAAMPLTANGKVDRRALPAPAEQAADARAVRAPRSPTEHAVLGVWREVLGRDALGIDDDFFASGGDSLAALPLVFKLHAALGVELPLSAVFAAPTVAGMAEAIDRLRSGDAGDEFDIEAQVVLPAEIDAARAAPAVAPREAPRSVLLTGATGFLGAYVLRDLLDLTVAEAVCLVRADDDAQGMRRIRANLERYGLWRDDDAARIVPLLGDLAAPALGLSSGAFDALAHRVDAIVHNGGQVNFIAPYAHLEAANVGGTREVLRLATTAQLKPVQLVSTLGVYLTPRHAGVRVAEAHAPPDGPGQHGGYNQSKWVSEQLGLLARARGVPVAIHRPARITGDAASGTGNADDYFSAWIRGCMALGLAPKLPGETFDMTPVDHVARAIVRIMLGAGDANGQYHYYNPRTLPIAEAVAAMRDTVGPIAEVDYPQWRHALIEAVAAGRDNPLKPFAGLFPEDAGSGEGPEMPDFDCSATEAVLAPWNERCPPADRALFVRYLRFLQRCGALPTPETTA